MLKILIGSTVRSLTPPLSGNMVWHWLKLLRPGAEAQGMWPSERAATLNPIDDLPQEPEGVERP